MTRRVLTRKHTAIALSVFVFLLFGVGYRQVPRSVTNIYEDIAYKLHPSSERAFANGIRHFDARNPSEYDLERAGKYFTEAQRLDPSYPHINLQLARYYFVKGNFEQALARIKTELRVSDTKLAAAYYVKALTLGFMGSYENAAINYELYLSIDPNTWSAYNDYAWVLLQAGRTQDALKAIDEGLKVSPENPWLLNSRATALFELKRYVESESDAVRAQRAAQDVTSADWRAVYPGNDPGMTGAGILALRGAIDSNLHKIQATIASSSLSR